MPAQTVPVQAVRAKDYAWAMKSNAFALRVGTPVVCVLCAGVWIVGCSDSAPTPKPPTAITQVAPSARAPQGQASGATSAAGTASATNPSAAPSATASATPTATPRADAAAQKISSSTSDAKIIEVAGLVMPKPVTWQWQSPTVQFRALQYSVPTTTPGISDAELVISVFAAGDGGPIDMNVKRWVSQFRDEDGDEAKAKIEDRTINGIPVKLLELAGRYQGMGQAAPRPGMMQLGAIIQAPGRTVFVRLVGQLETVEGARKEFEALVNGVRASE